MMDGFTMVTPMDGGGTVFKAGPYKNKTYREVLEDVNENTKKWVKHSATFSPKANLPVYQQGFRDWIDELGGVHEDSIISKCEEEGRMCQFKVGPGTNATHFRMVCTNAGCGFKECSEASTSEEERSRHLYT